MLIKKHRRLQGGGCEEKRKKQCSGFKRESKKVAKRMPKGARGCRGVKKSERGRML